MLAQVDAGALGPLLVADAHLLRRPWVILVELVEHALPVIGPAQLAGASGEIDGELVVRRLAAVAQLASAEAEQLLLAQQRRVALLAERPFAGRRRAHLLQELDVAVVGRRRAPPPPPPAWPAACRPRSGPAGCRAGSGRRRAPGSRRGRGRSPAPSPAAGCAVPSSRLSGIWRMRATAASTSSSIGRSWCRKRPKMPVMPGFRYVSGWRRQTSKSSTIWRPRRMLITSSRSIASSKLRLALVHCPEPLEPGVVAGPPALEGRLGQVVELLVVLGQAQAAGADRRLGELGVQELRRSARRRTACDRPLLRPGGSRLGASRSRESSAGRSISRSCRPAPEVPPGRTVSALEPIRRPGIEPIGLEPRG